MKKFMKYFNIFELDLHSKSYKSAIIRITVSLIIMLATCLFRFNVTISNAILNIVSGIVLLAVTVLSILCLFVAAVECLQIADNRKNDKNR